MSIEKAVKHLCSSILYLETSAKIFITQFLQSNSILKLPTSFFNIKGVAGFPVSRQHIPLA